MTAEKPGSTGAAKRRHRDSYAVRNLKGRKKFKYRLIFEGALIGIISGAIIACFRLLLTKVDGLRTELVEFAHGGVTNALIAGAVLVCIALVTAALLRFEPDISGSGIPQVEGELRGEENQNWWKVLTAKFAGCVLAIGGGLALGREGPSIQLGAMVGKGFARRHNRLLTEERLLITCGAGAGLSAAFSAPLAGAIFSLEELHRNFSVEVLISTMAATVLSDYVAVNIVGLEPVFVLPLKSGASIPLTMYWAVLLLGILLGAFGVVYNKTLDKMQDLFDRVGGPYRKMLAAMAMAFVMFFVFPPALGSGNGLVAQIGTGRFTLGAILLLLVVKFFFSTASFGSGAPGGIFLPLLVLGALTGGAFSGVLTRFLGVSPRYITAFVVIAMAGYFAAIVRAPVTGVVLITEMTGDFTKLLPLVLTSLTAFIVADALGGEPVYTQLLDRRLAAKKKKDRSRPVPDFEIAPDDGEGEARKIPTRDRKAVIDSEVYIGSMMDGGKIEDLSLPVGSLVVTVIRDDVEIIPSGQTRLKGGDELEILCRSSDIAAAEDILDEKCKTVVR